MLVKFPNGALKETGGPVGANLLVPNFSTLSISYGDYSGGNILYTAISATELALFMKLIYEAMRAGSPVLVLDSQISPPTLVSAVPNSATHNGNSVLLVTGTGFRESGSLTIGGAAVLAYQYISNDNLLVVTPPGTAGAVSLAYTDSRGTVTQAGLFTYT